MSFRNRIKFPPFLLLDGSSSFLSHSLSIISYNPLLFLFQIYSRRISLIARLGFESVCLPAIA
nr:MAG TPA: hypothetical protein [Caudoviricetes sp.]